MLISDFRPLQSRPPSNLQRRGSFTKIAQWSNVLSIWIRHIRLETIAAFEIDVFLSFRVFLGTLIAQRDFKVAFRNRPSRWQIATTRDIDRIPGKIKIGKTGYTGA
jgi:hypothetical protein